MEKESIENMVFTAATYCNTNVAEIARAIGMLPSTLYRKLKRRTIKPDELIKIGKYLGCKYVYYLSFPNGAKIGRLEKTTRKKRLPLKQGSPVLINNPALKDEVCCLGKKSVSLTPNLALGRIQ